MKYDDLPGGRHPQRHATSASPKSSEAIELEVQGDERVVNANDSGEPVQPGLDGERERADLKKTVPFPDSGLLRPEIAADMEGRFLGRFHLEREIARGGMGIIFKARDIDLDREVAIKLLLREHQIKPLIRQQFINEARITGRLQHPGIIPIYETGTTSDDRPYFAMKLVNGMTLANLLTARSSPQDDLPRFLNIFEHVCQTLSYTHSCGVIHLDIKPANVMVGAFGEVHLMDWGLARASADHCVRPRIDGGDDHFVSDDEAAEKMSLMTSRDLSVDLPAGAFWGTPAYMSPEQAQGQCVDVQSDVFGLGGILCEILTGYAPYRGTNFLDVCFKARQADLNETYSSLTGSGANSVLVRLAMKCLAPHPDGRPADAISVASELTLYLESLLRRAGSDLERFFELCLDLFCIAGLDGYFRRVNSNFSRVLGYSENELLSRPFMEFVHPDDRDQTIDIMSQLQLGHPVVQFRNRYSVSDGTWRAVLNGPQNPYPGITSFLQSLGILQIVRIILREARMRGALLSEPQGASGLLIQSFHLHRLVAIKAFFMRLSRTRSLRRVDVSRSNHLQSIFLRWLTAAALVNCGCSDASESTVPPSAGLASKTPVKDADDVAERINSARESQGGKTVSAISGSDEDSLQKTVNQTVEPTPEQFARWEREDFEPLQLLAYRESGETGLVSHLAHTPDGRHFITTGTGVKLWSIETDVPEHVFLELTDDQTIKSLAVSPDGKWFAAGDSEGTLRVWNIPDRKELNSKKLHSTGIIQISISPDSQDIATISYNDEITIWSEDQLQQKSQFKVDTNGLKRIEYMTPELLVAAGETTGSWNVRSGKLEKTLSPGRYNFTMARNPDGTRFLFGVDDALQFWNVTDQKPESRLAGSFATEEFAAFSVDGKSLATANGSSVRIWDIASGQLVQIIDATGWPITGLSWLPETNLLVVASVNGRIRFWGTNRDGGTLGMQPMHPAVAMPDGMSHEPASPKQMLQSMDFRIFPQLPEGERDGKSIDEFSLRYDAAVTADEAQLFYRYRLGKAGWNEVASAVATPNAMRFQKNGFMITASCYEGADSKTSISVNFGGNYDVRWAPKFDAAPIESVFENEDTVMYRTKADLIQLETTLLRKMHAAGWTAYARLHASHNEQEDGRDLEFLQHGMTLRVSISRFPADPASYVVQYSRYLTTKSIPVPPDSGFVEFDGVTEPFLVATTAMNLEQAREFYDNELTAEGWLVSDYGRILKDDHNWLPYVRGQEDLTVGLQSLPTGRTLVRVGNELEKSSWQLAKPKAPNATDTQPVGIEAADFPILNESKIAKHDAIDKSIEFSMDNLPLLEVGERYTKELLSRGWPLDGAGVKADDYVFLTFVKDNVEIALRARVTDGKSIVNIQGDGLLWTKELSGGRKVISYETWLRINHHPAGLDLLDEYQTEMRSIVEGNSKAEKPE